MIRFSTAQRLRLVPVIAFLAILKAHAQQPPAASTAEEPVRLQSLAVTEKVENAAEVPVQAAAADLAKVAGGVSLINSADQAGRRVATPEDLLAYQPGVFAQSAGGTDAVKISIRGSSLNSTPGYFRDGIQFLFDGLPITGPGGTPYELFETAGLNYTAVLRGANAFEYGSLAFGGAINFVTNTGYTSPGVTLHAEGGSFGWHKEQIAFGAVQGKADAYVSLTNSDRDGYQIHSAAETRGVASNFGYRFNENVETRLFIRYREQFNENPGTLTKAQLNANPEQANPTSITGKSTTTKRGSTWVGSKTTVKITPDSKLELGAVYHDYPQILSIDGVNPNYWVWKDINTSVKYSLANDFSGHQSNTTVGLFNTYTPDSGVRTIERGVTIYGPPGHLAKVVNYDGSYDFVASVGNDFEINEKLWLSSGLALSQIKRDIDVAFSDRPNTSPFGSKYNYDTWNLAPRVGLRYEFKPGFNVFGNISRSIDPPSTWKSSGSGVTNNYAKPLEAQKGTTAELGLRGKSGIFEGSLAVYRSWITNELLSTELIPAIGATPAVISESNASPTIHQGIEAGLDTLVWHSATKPEDGHRVIFRQAYTFNDFSYRHDPRFGDNQLPGIPDHVYQAEIQFQHATGFYAGVNLRFASDYFVDYNNTYKAPSYVIYGANAGFEAPSKKWRVYVDLKNITDKAYATTVTPVESATATSRVFYPGDGFGAYAGIDFHF